jgi:MFS transporter, ACS family, glucarate transporter
LVGIAAGIVWYLTARDTPEQHSMVGEAELALIRQGRELGATDVPQSSGKRRVPWARIFGSKEMIAVTLSYFSFGYVAWVFFGWFYIYMAQARGLNLKSSALYSMLPFVGMTLGCFFGGVASDWLARRFSLRVGRCILPFFSMSLTAVLLVLGSKAHQAETAGLILACGAGSLYIAQSCFWAVTADFAGEYTGLASGIMNMGAQIGGACTTSLTPLIAAHFGWHMSFFTAASLAALGAVAWLVVDPTRRLQSAKPDFDFGNKALVNEV